MAKYRALMNFRAIKEDVLYTENQEFDMTVARATELQANVDKNFPNAGQVMERIDVKEDKETKEGKYLSFLGGIACLI